MPTVLCKNPLCLKPFEIPQSCIDYGIRKHCSRECRRVILRQVCVERASKKCSACEVEKPLEDFYMYQSGSRAGLARSLCKVCSKKTTAAYAKTHPAMSRGIKRRYRATHPSYDKANHASRRARKANAPINDLTGAQFLEICHVFDFRCAYCPTTCKACKNKTHKLTQDHVAALAKDGNHTVQNVVPACRSCNSKKGTGPPLVPVQPLLLTIAPIKPQKQA